jgi:hypothetical protein
MIGPNRKFLQNDAELMPDGAILMFAQRTTCPPGWKQLANSVGRVPVGLDYSLYVLNSTAANSSFLNSSNLNSSDINSTITVNSSITANLSVVFGSSVITNDGKGVYLSPSGVRFNFSSVNTTEAGAHNHGAGETGPCTVTGQADRGAPVADTSRNDHFHTITGVGDHYHTGNITATVEFQNFVPHVRFLFCVKCIDGMNC